MAIPTRTSPPRRSAGRRNGERRNGERRAGTQRGGERRTALLGAALAAILAAGLFAVALSHNSAKKPGPAAPVVARKASVLVATHHIHRGAALAGTDLRITTVGATTVQSGALTSLDAVHGKVAATDISAGEQITPGAITADNGKLPSRLRGDERAVTLPIDHQHGMVGNVAAGDHVDVYGSFQVKTKADPDPHPVLKLIAQNVPVLRAPADAKSSGGAATGQITLELSSDLAQAAAFTADNGKLWVAERPAGGAAAQAPTLVTLESLLGDVTPITSAGGKP